MPIVKVTRAGIRPAARDVPTDTTAAILPMTVDRVGSEAPEEEAPCRVRSLAEAFEAFKPGLKFCTVIGEEGAEFQVDLEFRSLADFDPKWMRTRKPGRRNDLADLQSRINLLHGMRERFAVLSVKRAWENAEQRAEIIEAVREFETQLRRIANAGQGEDT